MTGTQLVSCNTETMSNSARSYSFYSNCHALVQCGGTCCALDDSQLETLVIVRVDHEESYLSQPDGESNHCIPLILTVSTAHNLFECSLTFLLPNDGMSTSISSLNSTRP